MKKLSNFIITLVLTAVMSLVILKIASNIFIPKWIGHDANTMSFIIKGFYKEPKDSLDVMFMGNSDVYRGVSPMKLYEETGITGYSLSSPGQRMWIAKPLLEEALKRQNPKIVFVNMDSFFYIHESSSSNYHKSYDNLHLGIPKIKGVFDSNYPAPFSEKITHFMPIFAFHSRYTELTKDDFIYAFYDYTNYTKGLDLVATKIPYNGGNSYMSTNDIYEVSIPPKNIKYLDDMIEICKKKNIELILIDIPSAVSWSTQKSIAVSNYAKERNVKFLDMNLDSAIEQMQFDWTTDTSDGGNHLNVYGAEKVAKYIADYLTENYNFRSHKDDKDYQYWNQEYEKYLEIKESEIRNEVNN